MPESDHQHLTHPSEYPTPHSLLTWSVAMRLGVVGVILAGMWLGVFWALQSA